MKQKLSDMIPNPDKRSETEIKKDMEIRNKMIDDAHEKLVKKFEDPDLIKMVFDELEKEHLMDDMEKLFVFMMSRTAFLNSTSDRKSICLKGDSSVGKDNLVKTVLKHTPDDSYLMLTGATQATMQDDIGSYQIIAYSEMNAHRDGGANSDLVEVVKQLTEGGTNTMKKDLKTGFKEMKLIEQEQKTIIYSTTEEAIDDELDTRFTVVTVRGRPEKTAAVNNNTLRQLNKTAKQQENDDWLKKGQELLKPYPVLFPCVATIEDSSEYFNTSDPRSSRDLKRIVSLAKAFAWLHQFQRAIVKIDGEEYIIGAPVDFINAIILAAPFLDSTYQGFDARVGAIYNLLDENDEQFDRDYICDKLRLKRSVFYHRMRVLVDGGFVIKNQPEGVGTRVVYTRSRTLSNYVQNPSRLFDRVMDFDHEKWLLEKGVDRVLDGLWTGSGRVLTGLIYQKCVVDELTLSNIYKKCIYIYTGLPSTKTNKGVSEYVSGKSWTGMPKVEECDNGDLKIMPVKKPFDKPTDNH